MLPTLDEVRAGMAGSGHRLSGTLLWYHHANGVVRQVHGSVRAGPMTREDERRSLPHEVVVSVSKAELVSVALRRDLVEVPGAWVRQPEATVRLLVEAVEGDRSDPTYWLLGLGGVS